MVNLKERPLTPEERNAIEHLRRFETAADLDLLVVSYWTDRKTAEAILYMDREESQFKLLSVRSDPILLRYQVSFEIQEYKRYVQFILDLEGMKANADGTVTTRDDLTVTSEYIQ